MTSRCCWLTQPASATRTNCRGCDGDGMAASLSEAAFIGTLDTPLRYGSGFWTVRRQVSARDDPPGRHVGQHHTGGLAMSAESVRAFLARAAPDLEIVELPASSQTHTLSAAWGIRAAQIAKTLALSVGGRAVLAVVCGDSRLDNKKVKAVLGGKATMLAPEEAATITGHVLGGVCPFGLATPMPIYCDVQLRAFDEVVPGAGSTHTALRIAPDRMAALSGAQWVDICVVARQGLVDSSDGRQ